MKLTTLFLIVSLFKVQAGIHSQNPPITLHVENVTLQEVFSNIESKSKFKFLYNLNDINLERIVTVNVTKKAVSLILHKLFLGTNLSFDILDKQIIIAPSNKINQQTKISGIVTNIHNEPLLGVTIRINTNQRGTTTDLEGNYTIRANKGDKITFSYIGFKPQDVIVGNKTTLNIVLIQDISKLDEVVVQVGYGKQKKKNVSSAISSVNMKDFEKISESSVSFDKALGGLIKGVSITQTSGALGAETNINIRGYTSPFISGTNQPLFVVDGVPFFTDAIDDTGISSNITKFNPLLSIDPENIKSIDVLKDAAATSIYGSRGANGVIIITTKTGRRNQKAQFTFSNNVTFSTPTTRHDVLNAAEFKKYQDLLFKGSVYAANLGHIDLDPTQYTGIANITTDPITGDLVYNGLNDAWFGNADINWNDEIFKTAVSEKYSLAIRGGNQISSYSLAANYTNRSGLVYNDFLKRYNYRLSFDTKVNKNLNAGVNAVIGHTNSFNGGLSSSLMKNIYTARPDLPIRDENGQFVRLITADESGGAANPLAKLQNENKSKRFNILGSSFIEAGIVKNLKLKGKLNFGYFQSGRENFRKKVASSITFGQDFVSSLDIVSSIRYSRIFNLSSTYFFKLNSKNTFNFLLGYSWDRQKTTSQYISYEGFPDDEVLTNISSANRVDSWKGGSVESGLNSAFARIKFNHDDKYLATINFRSDASTKFGPNNQIGYFPSFAASWNMQNEDFLKSSNIVDELKLRISTGKTGSSNIRNFIFNQFFQTNTSYNGNNSVIFNLTLPNSDIQWEVTKELNFGLDFILFNQRLFGSFDIYNRKTTGALVSTPFPYETGAVDYISNLSDISNHGIEVDLGYNIIENDNGFNWNFRANASFNRNKLDELHGANIDEDKFLVGHPIGTLRGYRIEKIFSDQAEIDALNTIAATNGSPDGFYDHKYTVPGDYKRIDTDGNGYIDYNDLVIIANPEPDFFGGFSNSFNYKGFSLDAFFQYSVGGEGAWIDAGFRDFYGLSTRKELAFNRWSPDNLDAKYPRLVQGDPANNQGNRSSGIFSDREVFSTSYLRLKQIQLSYRLKNKHLRNIGIGQVNFNLSISNLFTITKWPGLNPESGFRSSGNFTTTSGSLGANRAFIRTDYPLDKSVTLGFNIKF